MADKTRRGIEDEEFVDVDSPRDIVEEEESGPGDDSERGIAEDEDEFEDEDEDTDEDEEDEEDDLEARGITSDRDFTAEIGSEGGSDGDMETERPHPGVLGGSEATTTARPDARPGFGDRQAGGGIPTPRR